MPTFCGYQRIYLLGLTDWIGSNFGVERITSNREYVKGLENFGILWISWRVNEFTQIPQNNVLHNIIISLSRSVNQCCEWFKSNDLQIMILVTYDFDLNQSDEGDLWLWFK